MTPFVKAQIKRDESLRLKAYPDPDSPLATTGKGRGDPWTCGYGCTGPEIGPDTVWTQAQADQKFDLKFAQAVEVLDQHVSWWRHLDDVRQDVLVNMSFNLGWHRLSEFVHFLQDLQMGNYQMAANEMLASLWATQVKSRAQRLALMMRTGVSQSVH